MRVVAIRSENEVRRNGFLQIFENRFHFGAHVGHESVRETPEQRPSQPPGASEQRGRASRFILPNSAGAEHHPMKQGVWILLSQPQNGTTAPNFDIVGMSSQA